jgi:diguanylate cyclase (GGDEF)-like protein
MSSPPAIADTDRRANPGQPSEPVPPPALAPALAALLPALLAQDGRMLCIKDGRSGRLLHANAAFAVWLQRPGADLTGCTDADLFDPVLATALRAAEQTAQAQGAPLVSEHRFEHAGVRHEFLVLRLALPETEATPPLLCAVWSDLTAGRRQEDQLKSALKQIEELQRANDLLRRELADQALRDNASGLYSRAHFEDQLRREVDLSTREHREFAIVFVEIDPPGDAVAALGDDGRRRILEAMGRLLRGGTRAMDASCRFSEQRFAVLLSGVGLATAHARMEGLRRQCATQIVVHDGQELRFSVAMGVASFPHTAHTQEGLVDACNAALAEAQRRGGNHVTLAAIRFETETGARSS